MEQFFEAEGLPHLMFYYQDTKAIEAGNMNHWKERRHRQYQTDCVTSSWGPIYLITCAGDGNRSINVIEKQTSVLRSQWEVITGCDDTLYCLNSLFQQQLQRRRPRSLIAARSLNCLWPTGRTWHWLECVSSSPEPTLLKQSPLRTYTEWVRWCCFGMKTFFLGVCVCDHWAHIWKS